MVDVLADVVDGEFIGGHRTQGPAHPDPHRNSSCHALYSSGCIR